MPRSRHTGNRAAGRRPRPNTGILSLSRDGLRKLLRNRKWWPITKIVSIIRDEIRPELAARAFIEQSSRAREARAQMPLDIQIEEGLLLLVHGAAIQHGHNRVLERRYEGRYEELRLAEWYCWSCGHANYDARPEHGLCSLCEDDMTAPEEE